MSDDYSNSAGEALSRAFESLGMDREVPIEHAPYRPDGLGSQTPLSQEAQARADREQVKQDKLRQRDENARPDYETSRLKELGRRDSIERGFKKAEDQAREKTAKTDAKPKDDKPAVSADAVKDRELRRGIIEKAFEASKGQLNKKDLTTPEQRQMRRELKAKYPGKSIGEITKVYLETIKAAFSSDPVDAQTKLMEAYARTGPFSKDVPNDADKKGNRAALERASEDVDDLAALAPFLKKIGKDMPALIEEMHAFDKGMREDPVGFSARYAAIHGAPITPEQQAAYEQKQEQRRHVEHRHGEIAQAFDLIIQGDHLPGFDDVKMQNAMADALESGAINRTGHNYEDLKAAHAYVLHHGLHKPKQRGKGEKSISGAPDSGTRTASRQSGPPKSAREALERSFAKL